MEDVLRRYNVGYVRVVAQAEAYVEPGGDELTGELWLAAEAVYDPALGGLELPAQFHYAAEAAYTVYYQWFGYFFGYLGLLQEESFLSGVAGAFGGVEPGFSYGCDARVCCHAAKCFYGRVVGSVAVPRVYAYAIPCLAGCCGDFFAGIDVGYYPWSAPIVGVDIFEVMKFHIHGTGS